MSALVCDICGGKLVMGTGGIAVCESCGIQYNKESLQEKHQQLNGTVQIDYSNMIESWEELGFSAYIYNNYQEAYDYYTKIVEVDPKNWNAIWHRAASAGKLSEKGKSRLGEVFSGASNALCIIDDLIEEKPDEKSLYEKQKLCILDQFLWFCSDLEISLSGIDGSGFKDYNECIYYRDECSRIIDYIEVLLEYFDNMSNTKIEGAFNEEDVVKNAKSEIASTLIRLSQADSYHDSSYRIYYVGLSAKEKEKLYEKYCKYELESWDDIKFDRENFFFDPFDLPADGQYIDYEKHNKRLKEYWKDPLARLRASEEKRLKRVAREKYWAEHEGERKLLDESLSKATEERKRQGKLYNEKKQAVTSTTNKYNKQIGDLIKEIEDVKAEIDNTQAELSKLGFLDFKKAKVLKETIQKRSEEYASIKDKNTKMVQQLSIDRDNEIESIQTEMNEHSRKYNEELAKEKEFQDKIENPI